MRRTVILSALVVAAVLAVGLLGLLLASGDDSLPEPFESLEGDGTRFPTFDDGAVRFLAWGDAGHGSREQRATAEAARRVCMDVGCDFVVGLGDNVYDNGVEHLHDEDFRAKFEEPYRGLDLPFLMVLGNHDVRGNVSAQVDYSNVSEKWEMPGRNYVLREGDVLFVALDLTELNEGDASGAAELGRWTDEALAEEARWTVVFSHFPYASNGKHGNGSEEVRDFLERHVCGRADVYLAGHDHDLQWLEEQPDCPGTELVISGAASKARPLGEPRVPAHFAKGGVNGFFWFEAGEDRMVGRAYSLDGEVLFERVVRADER